MRAIVCVLRVCARAFVHVCACVHAAGACTSTCMRVGTCVHTPASVCSRKCACTLTAHSHILSLSYACTFTAHSHILSLSHACACLPVLCSVCTHPAYALHSRTLPALRIACTHSAYALHCHTLPLFHIACAHCLRFALPAHNLKAQPLYALS